MDAPRRLGPGDPGLVSVLALIRSTFAYMDGRIAPPSSMHDLTLEAVQHQARSGEVWAIGDPVRACVFLTPKETGLYLGKLAVRQDQRGQGLARQLVDLAGARARSLSLAAIELQTRIELTENQAAFRRLGFAEIARTSHPGFDRPTSITFRKDVPP